MATSNEWSHGKLINAAVGVPGIVTDCMAWEPDIGADRIGRAVNAAVGVPGNVSDCSAWDQFLWLELRLADDGTAPQKALAAAQQLAPALNLVADESRTRHDRGLLVVAIRPTAPAADTEAQLARVARSLAVGVTSAALYWAA